MTDYTRLKKDMEALLDGSTHTVSALANASALLWQYLDDINWCGFYLIDKDDPSFLILGPFQGKPACTEIRIGRGVCGTAVAEKRTVAVPDVELFPGHIACDSASRSEIVVPLTVGDRIVGVLDIDSAIKNRFADTDQIGLEEIAAIVTNSTPF